MCAAVSKTEAEAETTGKGKKKKNGGSSSVTSPASSSSKGSNVTNENGGGSGGGSKNGKTSGSSSSKSSKCCSAAAGFLCCPTCWTSPCCGEGKGAPSKSKTKATTTKTSSPTSNSSNNATASLTANGPTASKKDKKKKNRKSNGNNPFEAEAEAEEDVDDGQTGSGCRIDDIASRITRTTPAPSASFPPNTTNTNAASTDDLVHSPASTSSCPIASSEPLSPAAVRPAKLGFLVSFLVDARGGAMRGNRGSGLRLIIPQGAVDHPTRVTCRYLRGNGERLPFPPPLMEREALASRVIEMGPSASKFNVPVLLEVPHFASVRGGERELIVLRCDDGETWREHTTSYLQTSWQGGDEEIYADFVASTGLTAAYEELDTSRVVRISCTNFPKYFAILTRIKEEVRAIGAEGGKVVASHVPNVQGFFPVGALQKKIKVALQVQTVPARVLGLTCPNMGLRFSPLVAIEPRRRRFHVAVQVAVPLSGSKDASRVRLLCSLAANSTPKAIWEDVTRVTPIVISKGSVIFETRVSALFWAVYLEEATAEAEAALLPAAQHLYEELMLPPYMARFMVLHRRHAPHAWCDSLRIICVTDDKAEAWGEAGAANNWNVLAQSDEMEVTADSILSLEVEGGVEVAEDCQLEFGYRTSLTFKPFQSNFATLLVRPRKGHPKANQGHLIVKKEFGHLETAQLVAVTTIELDLRDPNEIQSLPDLEPTPTKAEDDIVVANHIGHYEDEEEGEPKPETNGNGHLKTVSADVYEDVNVPNSPVKKVNDGDPAALSDRLKTDGDSPEEEEELEEDDNDHVIQVKEYSPVKDDDVVFIQLTS